MCGSHKLGTCFYPRSVRAAGRGSGLSLSLLFILGDNRSGKAHNHFFLLCHYLLSINTTWKSEANKYIVVDYLLSRWKLSVKSAVSFKGKQNTSLLTRFQGYQNPYVTKTFNFGKTIVNLFIHLWYIYYDVFSSSDYIGANGRTINEWCITTKGKDRDLNAVLPWHVSGRSQEFHENLPWRSLSRWRSEPAIARI
jgi:hypothetical protein